ncbi:hypothetical protein FACS189465_1680 [Clostridia bacterium]|nr:hypothetical protein FACS189465_1680 [Clostridia bacterium]
MLAYAKEVFPNTFIAKRGYMLPHTTYITVPVCTGIVGAFFIFTFFIKSIISIVRYYLNNNLKNIGASVNFVSLFLLSMPIYCIFESEILFVNSICTFIFWLFLGFAIDYIEYETVRKSL